LEDQITIVAVATCHEINRRDRRELSANSDSTRAFVGFRLRAMRSGRDAPSPKKNGSIRD
jgi:hypothetical protein